MLIIPVTGKNNKKQFPVMTLALIVVNIIVYFFFQANDHYLYQESMRYYHDSGLLNIELSAYKNYLEQTDKESLDIAQQKSQSADILVYDMLRDHKFLSLLRSERIIKKDTAIYSDWRQKRDNFESRQSSIVMKRYGYSPVEKNRIGLLTHMFLHGSTMHLVGNMVFLYFVGALLESAIGPFFILAGYLVTGIAACSLFAFVYPLSPGPLVGASGAIAGLMGGYAILFRLRKVKIFYSLGFYFNYATIPALVLLPIWLGNEFFQLYINPESQVAYMAHVGGLASGGILGGLHLLFRRDAVDEMFQESEQKDRVAEHLEKGMNKMAQLNMKEARKHMSAILKIQPDHRTALRHLFNIDKSNPQSDQFHTTAAKLLSSMQSHEDDLFIEFFERYKRLAKKPKMSKRTVLRLIRTYLNRQEYEKAEGYVALLVYYEGEQALVPDFLLRLAEGYRSVGKTKKSRTCLGILAKRFGTSNAAIKAQEIFQATSPDLTNTSPY